MSSYRRAFQPGGTFFLTLVTERRRPIFETDIARLLLRYAIERCRVAHPFELDATVLLPDHLHLQISLPSGDADFSERIRSIKFAFTRLFLAEGGEEAPRTHSKVRQRGRGIWQRRFWEHTIRDETDRDLHLDYIHYNPVKHGYVACPHAWQHSSFHRFVKEQQYEQNWYCACHKKVIVNPKFDDIAQAAGE